MKSESIEHLLTVLRGRMQEFEAMQDFTNQAEAWDLMLQYLKSWIDKHDDEIKAKIWDLKRHPMTALETRSLKLKARNAAFGDFKDRILNEIESLK